jgi:diguanylate cyclase (GGDEF)-like protein
MLLFASTCHTMMAGVLLLFWLTRNTGPGFGWWVWNEALVAIGLIALLARQWLPLAPTAIVSNAALIFCVPMIELGLRIFLRRRLQPGMTVSWLLATAVFAVWLGALLNGADTVTRVQIISIGNLLQYGWGLSLFVRCLTPATRVPLGLLILGVAIQMVVYLLRVAPLLQGGNPGYQLMNDVLLAWLILASVFCGIGRTCAKLMLVHGRIESELRHTQAALEKRANVDALTQLASRSHFESALPLLQANAQRRQLPMALLLFDIDHFKQINDELGHQAGDAMLSALGGLTAGFVRQGDLVGRLGGDEFAVLLFDCPLTAAQLIADRLREQVRTLHTDDGRPLSISAGLTTLAADEDFAAAYSRADVALYAAKAAGRNRIQLHASAMTAAPAGA